MVLPHPDPGHSGQVGKLMAVRIPYLCDVIQMLISLPEIAVIDRARRPSFSTGSGAY
jgi:hypothetical protein